MKKVRNSLLIIVTMIITIFYFDNTVAHAEKLTGEPAKLNIEFRVYTDIDDIVENTTKGGYITVYGSTYVGVEDSWENDSVIFNKTQKVAEEALKKATGKDYSVLSLIKSTYDNKYLYEGSSNVGVGYAYSREVLSVFFKHQYSKPLDDYNLVINVFANEGGPLNGWRVYGDAQRYYENSQYKTGVNKVGQTTYLFDSYGAKQYGWNVVKGWSMYFNEENGGLWTGKRKIGETTYLFNSQGHKIDGWHRLNGKDYYFNEENGGMWTGKRKIGRTTYLLHNDGYKIYGWFVDNNGDKYYFDPNYGGGMVTGLRKVGNAYYYFDTEDGNALANDSKTISGQSWYFNSSGIGEVVK